MTDIKPDAGTGLTALIPTFNSEAILEDCLASVSCADEILVIDSFSTDRTVEIACKHGARVIQHAYENSARQKNRGIPLCANSWVLQLDTDERLEPALQEEIREAIRTAPPGVDAFEMRTKNYLFGKWSRTMDLYPGWRVRLFRRDAGRFENKEVDARVTVAGKVARLHNHVVHFGTERITDRLGKLDRYSRYEADERIKVGRPFSAAQMIVRTVATFFYYYIAKRGITDGIRGLLYSVHKADFIFWTYGKMWEASAIRGKATRGNA